MKFYSQLNGFRFLFILFVLLEHWGPRWVYEKFDLGSLGVDLFFVLSGFLIGEILLTEKNKSKPVSLSLKNFYIRRALRIFPVYYLSIIVYGALFTTGGILLWNLTYTNNILECIDKARILPEYSHLWSLCVEEQFYVIFPFLVFFLNTKAIYRIVVAGILIAVIGRAVLATLQVHDYYVINMRFTLFALDCLFGGVLLAYLKTYHTAHLQKFFSKGLVIKPLIVLLFIAVYIIRNTPGDTIDNTLYRLNAAVLGFLLIGFSVMKGFSGFADVFLRNPLIAYLGKISYGIYIFHTFVKEIYYRYFSTNAAKEFFVNQKISFVSNLYVVDFISMFLLTVLLACLSYEVMEKKLLTLKNRFA